MHTEVPNWEAAAYALANLEIQSYVEQRHAYPLNLNIPSSAEPFQRVRIPLSQSVGALADTAFNPECHSVILRSFPGGRGNRVGYITLRGGPLCGVCLIEPPCTPGTKGGSV